MAARALTSAAGRPDPGEMVTAHYLSPGRTGDVRIATQILRDGKRFAASGTATMESPVTARCWPCSARSAICHSPRGPS